MPSPYLLVFLLEDLVKRVLRFPLTRINRFMPSLDPGTLTGHKPIIIATRLAC
jgi:hypothetical protein